MNTTTAKRKDLWVFLAKIADASSVIGFILTLATLAGILQDAKWLRDLRLNPFLAMFGMLCVSIGCVLLGGLSRGRGTENRNPVKQLTPQHTHGQGNSQIIGNHNQVAIHVGGPSNVIIEDLFREKTSRTQDSLEKLRIDISAFHQILRELDIMRDAWRKWNIQAKCFREIAERRIEYGLKQQASVLRIQAELSRIVCEEHYGIKRLLERLSWDSTYKQITHIVDSIEEAERSCRQRIMASEQIT